MKSVPLTPLLLVAYLVGVESLRCQSCENVYHPKDCSTTVTCGIGEVCFSEEYSDYNGKPAHRLGCTHRNGCSASSGGLIGKRDNSGECFRCCGQDECNINLCFNQKPATKDCSKNSGCPSMFVPFQDHCYITRYDWRPA